MKELRKSNIIILFFLFTITLSCTKNENRNSFQIDNFIDSTLLETLDYEDSISFEVNTLTNFKWDSLFVIYPYRPTTSWISIAEIEYGLSIDLSPIKNIKLDENQDYAILCFLWGDKLKKYAILDSEIYNVVDSNHNSLVAYLFGYHNSILYSYNDCCIELRNKNKRYIVIFTTASPSDPTKLK